MANIIDAWFYVFNLMNSCQRQFYPSNDGWVGLFVILRPYMPMEIPLATGW